MFRNVILSVFILIASSATAAEVGVLRGMQASVIVPCGQLLVTGQFLAPEDVTSIQVKANDHQAAVTVLELEIVNKISDGATGKRLVPFNFSTDKHPCPYGVSVSFDDQTVLVGVTAAQAAQTLSQ
jgi:hypothetical protein